MTVCCLSLSVCWLLSCVWLFVTPWTVAHQAPRSMEFSRQEYQSGLPFHSAGESSWPRDRTEVSSIARKFFTVWATREALSLSVVELYYCSPRKPPWQHLFPSAHTVSHEGSSVVWWTWSLFIWATYIIFWAYFLRYKTRTLIILTVAFFWVLRMLKWKTKAKRGSHGQIATTWRAGSRFEPKAFPSAN